MMVKAGPHYALSELRLAFGDPARLRITVTAQTGAMALGLTNEDVSRQLCALSLRDFIGTIVAEHDPTQVMDVYKPSHRGITLYVKITRGRDGALYVVSFKRN